MLRVSLPRCFLASLSLVLTATSAWAVGPYRNRDNKDLNDSAEPTYPVPYQMPTVQEVTEVLQRIRGYMEVAAPTRVIDKKTGQEITDFTAPNAAATVDVGPANFHPQAYEMGVVHAGMLQAAAETGDKRFSEFTRRHMQFFADRLPYFRAQEEKFHLARGNGFARMLDPRALDDSGSMCAALIRARQAGVSPDLKTQIDVWIDWISKKQFRLADGTMARQRPQAQSLWADDFYMSVPALAEMGRMTGNRAYFDDAMKTVNGMTSRLFNPQLNIYAHGWNASTPDAPQFYWARANGWAVVTMCDLLDAMPKDHPGYQKVLAQLRLTLKGIAQYQSGEGLWHQMLDRNDSFLETSATAMFVYSIAHAVNQGWLSATTWGSIAQAGWVGLTTRVNAKGQVEGTCVGTTYASDQIYYYNRPVSVDALHGYGPTLLAGVEMIRMLKNPKFDIEYKLRTYHYVPKDSGKTDYREHEAPPPGK